MKYDHILIRYDEIFLKGKNLRQFINQLQDNIRHKLKAYPEAKLKETQGRMYIVLNGHDEDDVMEMCKQVFGIHSMRPALKVDNDEEAIKEAALYALRNTNHAKTFKVSARRVDKTFHIRSQEMNRLLGAYILRNTEGVTVDVHEPDLHIRVEVRADATYITSRTVYGPGGLPVGSSGKTLLMLSGGIDSPVAGYLAMKRGVKVEAIHFHSPPFTSDRAKQKALDAVEQLTKYGLPIRVHLVHFTKLQQEIFRQIPERYAMTVMRRIMFRISEAISKKRHILSITTGESMGQVASQTMESMHAINAVTDYPILRPLIAMDKSEITAISREIGTYNISIRPYDDCCTIFVPKSPKTRPRKEKVEEIEAEVDFSHLIDEAVADTEVLTVEDKTELEDKFADLF